MGDDMQDLAVMKRCGLAVAPQGGSVGSSAHYVTGARRSRRDPGAVRPVIRAGKIMRPLQAAAHALLLVALTLWLVLVQAPDARPTARHDPDLIVENLRAQARRQPRPPHAGGEEVVHYPDDDSALLETVKVEAYSNNPSDDHSRQRPPRAGGERVLIEGNVVIVRDADAKTDAARITTEKLLVLPDAGIARTDTEVKMDSATGQAVAQGLEIDNRARTMRLDRVVATYQRPRK